MLLPSDFKDTVADTFYDKTVTKLDKTQDSVDGWIQETGTASSTFKANVQFDNLGTEQTDMGLTEQIDVSITTYPDTDIAVNDLFEYDGITYKAMAVVTNDSHKRIAGEKWHEE